MYKWVYITGVAEDKHDRIFVWQNPMPTHPKVVEVFQLLEICWTRLGVPNTMADLNRTQMPVLISIKRLEKHILNAVVVSAQPSRANKQLVDGANRALVKAIRRYTRLSGDAAALVLLNTRQTKKSVVFVSKPFENYTDLSEGAEELKQRVAEQYRNPRCAKSTYQACLKLGHDELIKVYLGILVVFIILLLFA
ncbi:hypothetical protein AaE_016304 [Aphanomyces astaci]|uniref:Uncharacterized protein n=1 Tax=Aphanomyces astaci TaxID=112090 RepID=A0A6A4Z4B3_APHAT|nr:hypothetical protein AaE_016304 [Aphanomyces astaci]